MEAGAGNRKSDLQNDTEIIKRIWLFMQHIWTDRDFQGSLSVSFGRCLWLLNMAVSAVCKGSQTELLELEGDKTILPFWYQMPKY